MTELFVREQKIDILTKESYRIDRQGNYL